MYVIPFIVLILIAAIAVAWAPIFALVVAGILFVVFLAYIGLRPRADEMMQPPTGSANRHEDSTHTGAWGEQRS